MRRCESCEELVCNDDGRTCEGCGVCEHDLCADGWGRTGDECDLCESCFASFKAESSAEQIAALRTTLAAVEAERDALREQVARLHDVLRQTHTTYCDEIWTSRDLHAPECLLEEIEDAATAPGHTDLMVTPESIATPTAPKPASESTNIRATDGAKGDDHAD